MLVTAEKLEIARPTQSLAPRYESLIRVAEAIRSHRNQKDLFQLLAVELRQVVPFDAMAQVDHAGNKVNWHFSEDYDSSDKIVNFLVLKKRKEQGAKEEQELACFEATMLPRMDAAIR